MYFGLGSFWSVNRMTECGLDFAGLCSIFSLFWIFCQFFCLLLLHLLLCGSVGRVQAQLKCEFCQKRATCVNVTNKQRTFFGRPPLESVDVVSPGKCHGFFPTSAWLFTRGVKWVWMSDHLLRKVTEILGHILPESNTRTVMEDMVSKSLWPSKNQLWKSIQP